jgi:Ca2+-binding RTX toxin-like protein
MNSNTSWRVLLRYTLVSTLALVGITGRPGTILAQGSNCATAPVVAINPVPFPVFNLASGAHHYFRVSIPNFGIPTSKAHLTVSTEGELDTVGDLFDAQGFPVVLNGGPNSGDGFNFFFSQYLLPGVYCVRVRGYGSDVIGAYRLKIQGDLANDDYGSDVPSAKVIRSNLLPAKLAVPNDWDFFRIEIKPGGGTVQVETEGFLDTVGDLLDAQGFPVVLNGGPNSGDGFNFRFSVNLPQGRYYVKVRGYDLSEIGDYRLKITSTAIVIPPGTCAGVAATIVGTEGPDIINGTAGPDIIQALGGNDTVYGFGGNDRICGGIGDDVLVGGEGNDVLIGDAGNNILRGENGTDYLYGNTGVDILDGGSSIDRLYGYAGNDVLVGGSENDFLYGHDGNDVLVGGLGLDVRDGGLNKDVCEQTVGDPAPLLC